MQQFESSECQFCIPKKSQALWFSWAQRMAAHLLVLKGFLRRICNRAYHEIVEIRMNRVVPWQRWEIVKFEDILLVILRGWHQRCLCENVLGGKLHHLETLLWCDFDDDETLRISWWTQLWMQRGRPLRANNRSHTLPVALKKTRAPANFGVCNNCNTYILRTRIVASTPSHWKNLERL